MQGKLLSILLLFASSVNCFPTSNISKAVIWPQSVQSGGTVVSQIPKEITTGPDTVEELDDDELEHPNEIPFPENPPFNGDIKDLKRYGSIGHVKPDQKQFTGNLVSKFGAIGPVRGGNPTGNLFSKFGTIGPVGGGIPTGNLVSKFGVIGTK
jgi:hypothetical protein